MMMRRVAAAMAVIGFGAAAAWSLRLGWAEHYARQESVTTAEEATRIAPDNAEYHARLGALLADEDAARSRAEYEKAVALNPHDSKSWIELGLGAEFAGDQAGAERFLLRAAEMDRQYLPRWTLANYYFRRGDTAKFWEWAGSAAEMSYGDTPELFRLAGRVAEDGRLVDRLRLRRPEVRANYLRYLMGAGRADLMLPAVRAVLDSERDADSELLLAACDRLIESKLVDAAVRTWNGMIQKRRIPFQPIDAAGAGPLTNGAFEISPTSHGFDWRLPRIPGVEATPESFGGGLRIAFTGHQPQRCEPAVEYAPVAENTAYQLDFKYTTSDIPPFAGVAWRITDDSGRVLGTSGSLSSAGGTRATLEFQTPPGCRLIRIALGYERARGTTRPEGYIILQAAQLRKG